MAEYKLTYFNSRGLAEPIRFIFALAGVEYEDIRVEKDDWPGLKPNFRWGQVPVLQFGEQELAQSATIARFLARKYKLAGEDEVEEARVDELVDAVKDLQVEYRKIRMETDEEKKAELNKAFAETYGPDFLTKLTAWQEANGGTWLVGKNVTWADLYIANVFDIYSGSVGTDLLENFPAIKSVQEAVFALPQIKEWIEKRPQTEM